LLRYRTTIYHFKTISFNFPKSGVPKPVTGSHPTVACHKKNPYSPYESQTDFCEKSTHVEPRSPTPRRVPNHDIIEPIPIRSVNHRIEEPQRAFSRCEPRIVQQGNKSGDSGCRRRRAINVLRASFEEYPKINRLGRDVRVRLHKKTDDDRCASKQIKEPISSPSQLRDNGVRVRVLGG
jgi:hypothetical protein